MPTETLTSAPGLTTPYLKAAFEALPLPTGSRPKELTDREVALDGLAVDRANLARYAQVCGFRQNDDVPATYLHVLALPLSMHLMSAGDFPFPLIGLVHVANRIELSRSLRADDSLDVRVRAADLRPHRAGTQVDLVADFAAAGEQVGTCTSTYLHRHHRDDKPTQEQTPDGELTTTATWRVDDGTGRRYAAVSGDRNPIHLHALSAKLFGFPSAIAHGMWTAARALAALEGRVPGALDYQVEFRKPLLLPSTVELATARRGDGWELAVSNAKSGAAHLHATVETR